MTATATVPMLSIDEFNQQRRDNCFLIDVRTPAEFREKHVQGAENFPLDQLATSTSTIQERRTNRPIVLMCRTQNRASQAHQQLASLNVTSLHILQGGIQAWEQAGHPMQKSGKAVMSIERQTRIAAGSLVAIGSILGAFVHPGFLAIPAFVGSGLVFAGITDTCGMGMILARMPWNR